MKEESFHHAEEKKGELAAAEEDQKEAEAELAEEIRSGEEEYQGYVDDCRQWNEKKEKGEEEKKALEEALACSEASYAEKLKVNRQQMSEKMRMEQELAHVEETLQRLEGERKEALSSLEEKKKRLAALQEELALLVKEEKEGAERLSDLEEAGKKDSLLLKEEENRRFALMNEKGKQESALSAIRSRKNYLDRAEKEYADFPWQSKISWPAGISLAHPFMALWGTWCRCRKPIRQRRKWLWAAGFPVSLRIPLKRQAGLFAG